MKSGKKILNFVLIGLAIALSLASANPAAAAAPVLTLTSTGDGDSIELAVTGEADKNVVFYYTKTGSGTNISYLGKTNSSGYFSVTLSATSYSISADSPVYVTVNNVASNQKVWPYLSAAKVLSLSTTSLVLSLGRSTSLTAYNNGTNLIYLSNNSNPPVAGVNIDGNQITVKALNYGSTMVTVCAQATSPSCASAYVSVQNTGAQPIVFSQNNASVASGQNVTVSVLGGTGAYVLRNNSSPAAIQASLSGSVVTLSTTLTSGSSSITICSSDSSSCGIINAVVGSVSSTGLTFSQTNPIMNIGQSLSLTISGGAGGNYSVSSNTNSAAVTASISNSNLLLVANAGGKATITVCSSMGSCAAEDVTVNYNTSTTGGSVAVSQNNLWLNVGQSASITVTGGSRPYGVSGYSENILKAGLSNDILTITGVGGGSAAVNVCSASGGCTILSVLISGAVQTQALSLSPSSLAMNAGENKTVSLSGGGNYFVAYNTNQTSAAVTINGSVATVNALAAGKADVSICQNGGQCAVLSVTVNAAALPQTAPTSAWTACADEKMQCFFTGNKTVRYGASGQYYYANLSDGIFCSNSIFGDPIENVVKTCSYGGEIPAGAKIISKPADIKVKFKFSKTLVYGSSGNDVKELQQRLKDEGFFNGVADGKYLVSTVSAVKNFQKSKRIKQTGNFGALTMAALNQ